MELFEEENCPDQVSDKLVPFRVLKPLPSTVRRQVDSHILISQPRQFRQRLGLLVCALFYIVSPWHRDGFVHSIIAAKLA